MNKIEGEPLRVVFSEENPVRTKSYFDVVSSDTVFNTGDLITGVFRYTFG